jgi:hypothetical protein
MLMFEVLAELFFLAWFPKGCAIFLVRCEIAKPSRMCWPRSDVLFGHSPTSCTVSRAQVVVSQSVLYNFAGKLPQRSRSCNNALGLYSCGFQSNFDLEKMVRDTGFELGGGMSKSGTYNARLTRRLTERERSC